MSAPRMCLIAGALFGITGVALGAWGAHGLAAYLGRTDTGPWDTAVLYQLVHAPVLLVIGLWQRDTPTRVLTWAGAGVGTGVLLFSGSLYLLTLGGPAWLGPVTPVGGLALIAGWGLLVWASLTRPGRA